MGVTQVVTVDQVVVVSDTQIQVVSAGTQGPAGPAGPGFISAQRTVAGSLTSDSATAEDGLILWNSSAAAPKTEVLPASRGGLQVVIVQDFYGNSSTYPITISVAGGGDIDNAYSSVDIATNNGSLTFIDSELGWITQ